MPFCTKCGSQLDGSARHCSGCGTEVREAVLPHVSTKVSAAAIASAICAVSVFIPYSNFAAVILGHVARKQIKNSNGGLRGDALAFFGLALGYAVLVIEILAALAIP